MPYTIDFPTDDAQCEDALNDLVDNAKQERHIHEVDWWMVHYYLQGAREFRSLDYARGIVDIGYYNTEGELKFRYDWIVSKYQAQLGRLSQVDLSPSVTKRNIGLEDMRKASTAQVVLNEVFNKDRVQKVKSMSLPPLLKYGTIGLCVTKDGEDRNIDVCPPWELLPIPPSPVEASDLRGKCRIRIVPMDWVKQLSYTKGARAAIWDEMETVETTPGQMPTGSQESFSTFGGSSGIGSALSSETYGTRKKNARGSKKDESRVKLVEFVEVWTETSDGFLKEYIVLSGKRLIFRKDFKEFRISPPMNIAHDIPTGGFWNRSFCSTLLPINMELEYSIGQLLQNVQDLDAFGILMEPTTMGLPRQIMRGTDGIKRARFEPDYTVPDLKPFNIAPANTGKMPVEAIKMVAGLGNELSNQPTEMMGGGAPGRVDSKSGLGFLYEVSNMPLAPIVESLADAMIGCYKNILDMTSREWDETKLVEVTLLDDSIAGVSMDPATGQVILEKGSVPVSSEVLISVASLMPKSTEQEKAELKEALQLGLISLTEFRIEVRRRGLNIPVGNEAEWHNYRRAVMENIILFGDGKSTGKVIVSEQDMHMVHLQVLLAFMARPEFFMASTQVRDAFTQHYTAHLMAEGGQMPDQAPYPEDGAEEQQMMEQMASQLPQGGGGGGQEQMSF